MCLSPCEKSFASFAINQFGTGRHPEASDDTLLYFNINYLRQCVELAAKSKKVSDEGHARARAILEKTSETNTGLVSV